LILDEAGIGARFHDGEILPFITDGTPMISVKKQVTPNAHAATHPTLVLA
jgi:hypothetical protein